MRTLLEYHLYQLKFFFHYLYQTGELYHHKLNIVLSEKRNLQEAGIINYIKENFIYKTKFMYLEHT